MYANIVLKALFNRFTLFFHARTIYKNCKKMQSLNSISIKFVFFKFRFELTSTESGLILSCYDIAGSATVLFVAYVGGRGHIPLWIGWGMFLVGLSGIIFSLPHFTYSPPFIDDIINFCGNATTEECNISSLKDFR